MKVTGGRPFLFLVFQQLCALSELCGESCAVAGVALLMSAGTCSWAGAQQPASRGDTIRIENARLRIGFSAADGRLVELIDRESGQPFVSAPGDLWVLNLLTGDSAGIAPANARRFTATRLTGGGGAGLQLVWRDFGLAAAPGLRVTVTVRMQGSAPMSEWRIALDSVDSLGVETVRFPRIASIPALGAGEELAVPRWMGSLARDPRRTLVGADGRFRRQEWAYPGALSMQTLALYRRDGPGLYAAADDTLAYRKSFAIWGDSSGALGYELLQVLPDPAATRARWTLPYAALIGTFTGDWITAAERYRAWGTRQVWARESRLKRGLVPAWLLDTGLWIWNRGRSPGVIEPAVALQQALGLPVRVFWHWWHGGPYDTSFPEYLPPREGADAFTRSLAAAHGAGVRAIVYMNQRLWCTRTASWTAENAARAAVKEKDGRVRTETYNVFDPTPCATMDVTQPFWRTKYASIADTVLNQYGVDGIYMDQAVQSLVCYDPTHGHPVGGGRYWMDGFNALATDIRRRAPNKAELLAGEGAGEPWLPSLDLMLTLQVSTERYMQGSGWDVIPFFQAVYHDYGVTYGSYSSLTMPPYDDLWPAATAPAEPLKLLDRKFQRQFYLEHARSFVWGLQPTIANFLPAQLQERPEETAYMMRLARVRNRALDYLLYGTFLRPPALNATEVDVDLSRISIYVAQRGGPTTSQGRYPSAIAGAWRARDGNIAIAVASILNEPQTVSFTFDPAAYGLSGGGQIYRIDETGRQVFGRFAGATMSIRLDLPPGGAYVLEFRR